MLDVPYELVEHVSWLIYARRRELGTRRRKPSCFQQALLVLAHLRKNETLAQVGAGFGASEATTWRYVDEAIEVLAAWAPGLPEALTGLGEGDVVIVDGTLIPTDRITADEPYSSQRHKRHGVTVQVVAAPDGTLHGVSLARRAGEGFSRALPGRTHDLTSPSLRPGGAPSPGPRHRPGLTHGHRDLPEHYQRYNRDHARLRTPGECAFARLKSWRLLRRARCSTSRIGRIVTAVQTLLTCQYTG